VLCYSGQIEEACITTMIVPFILIVTSHARTSSGELRFDFTIIMVLLYIHLS
jgi:hypothetical protein